MMPSRLAPVSSVLPRPSARLAAGLCLAGALVLLAGCSAAGGLPGSAVQPVPPVGTAPINSEGRGSPTGVSGRIGTDGNGNQTLDSGEPGLSGASVWLWQDGNQDGNCQGTEDTMVGTTTSGPDGSFQFGNILAGPYCLQGAADPNAAARTMSAPFPYNGSGVVVNIAVP